VRPPRPNPYRDAWAGELDAQRVGEQVRVAGWVHRRRDHGGLIFIDLRDRSGIVQLVFHPRPRPTRTRWPRRLRAEHVVSAGGEVVRREEGNVNPKLRTGEIELTVAGAERLAESETPPFPLDDDGQVDELLRLQHRVVDLRRQPMQDVMALRHTIIRAIRDYLNSRDFLDIETPILTRSTPEGARDFLVPARMTPGAFYALPQSPQLFKQMLMMAGYERYYQIARCFATRTCAASASRSSPSSTSRCPSWRRKTSSRSSRASWRACSSRRASRSLRRHGRGFPIATPWRATAATSRRAVRARAVRPREALAGTEFKVFAGALGSGGVVRGINAGAARCRGPSSTP
jgi:aspartyl-tRNA synthetase